MESEKLTSTAEANSEAQPETLTINPQRPVSQKSRQACLVHIYPTGPGMGGRVMLGETSFTLGRSSACDICLPDRSVSRQHARLNRRHDCYFLIDLGSTNGTFVNDVPWKERQLEDGDYIRVGKSIFRFLVGGNVEADYHEEIYRLTIIDALTEAHNKRSLLEYLQRELARSARHGSPLALLMIDVDKFKVINDELGHLAGDLLLRELAAELRKEVRTEDLLARYGGEEFTLVLVECSFEGAFEVAERLRQRIAGRTFRLDGNQLKITVSIGVTHSEGNEVLAPLDLIRRADEKLYQAKNQGRNRVCG